ncbi:MAG: hypothetical protein GY758_12605 [Fuerstiella sp.]|nr:hypothetical protein [Fuerstiella sp.]MCP4505525.1 hypothetical protein [Fuerstiella sp.]MDG2126399.1 hypothetical protein [Fuerstiella sp.]
MSESRQIRLVFRWHRVGNYRVIKPYTPRRDSETEVTDGAGTLLTEGVPAWSPRR